MVPSTLSLFVVGARHGVQYVGGRADWVLVEDREYTHMRRDLTYARTVTPTPYRTHHARERTFACAYPVDSAYPICIVLDTVFLPPLSADQSMHSNVFHSPPDLNPHP